MIFDPVLKICNWPETTTCISDLVISRRKPSSGSSSSSVPSFSSSDAGSSQFSKDIAAALRHAATETPEVVSITPANKLSKRILSLFQSRERKPNNRIRTNNFLNTKNSENISDIRQKHKLSAFKDNSRVSSVPKPSFSRNSYQTTTSTTTTARATSPRVTIRPFRFRNRQNTVKSPSAETKPVISNIFQQLPKSNSDRYQRVTDKVEAVTEAEDDEVVTRVRSEASVSSVSSYVRVSVSDLSSLEHERPFSNGRGGDQFDKDDTEHSSAGDDTLTRLRQELELSDFSAPSVSTTQKPNAKPIKCHTGRGVVSYIL